MSDNDVLPPGNGYAIDKRAIEVRLNYLERRIDDLEETRDQWMETRGGVRAWIVILTLVGAPILSAGTAWALRSYEDKRVGTLIEELIDKLDRQNMADRSQK